MMRQTIGFFLFDFFITGSADAAVDVVVVVVVVSVAVSVVICCSFVKTPCITFKILAPWTPLAALHRASAASHRAITALLGVTALHGAIAALHGAIAALHGAITTLHGAITALHWAIAALLRAIAVLRLGAGRHSSFIIIIAVVIVGARGGTSWPAAGVCRKEINI